MARTFYKQSDTGHTKYVAEDSKVFAAHFTDRNIAKAVMQRNKELQRNPGAVRTTSFGKLELDIPLSHMPVLDRYFPGIANPSDERHKYALRAFMKSPASAPYRLQEQKRGVNRGAYIKA